jgi:hypothetical protein
MNSVFSQITLPQTGAADMRHLYFIPTKIFVDKPSTSYITGFAMNTPSDQMVLLTDFKPTTIVHEMGHCYDLPHIFDLKKGGKIIDNSPQYNTRNIMDYVNKNNPNRDHFRRSQWEAVWNTYINKNQLLIRYAK